MCIYEPSFHGPAPHYTTHARTSSMARFLRALTGNWSGCAHTASHLAASCLWMHARRGALCVSDVLRPTDRAQPSPSLHHIFIAHLPLLAAWAGAGRRADAEDAGVGAGRLREHGLVRLNGCVCGMLFGVGGRLVGVDGGVT